MSILVSGEYLAKQQRVVVVWPKADANGDGAEVWVETKDDNGNVLERVIARDGQGREIRDYLPPEGFQNRPSYDHTDNWVKVDARGNVVRQPGNGEAICMRPGRAVIYLPDGSVEYLDDEYAQHLFNLAHLSTIPPIVETAEEKAARLDAEKKAKLAELQRQVDAVNAS